MFFVNAIGAVLSITVTTKLQFAVPHALVAVIKTVVCPTLNAAPLPVPVPLPVVAPVKV